MNIEEWKERYGVVEEQGMIDMDDLEETAELIDGAAGVEWRDEDGDRV